MSRGRTTTYNRYVAFKATDDLVDRLDRFSQTLGRQRSDVVRFMLTQLLNAYSADPDAIRKLREQLH